MIVKTRDRIVHEARLLFNAQGYGNVTTATLAAHLGISEGNLWYHFKTKRAILQAIAGQYAAMIEARLALAPAANGNVMAEYTRLLQAVIDEFRTFRFLFRDQKDYGDHAEPIAAHAPEWIERTYVQLHTYLGAMVTAGLLNWPCERLHDLAVNATIILRYGLDHYRELGMPTEEGSGAVQKTLLRHLTLFEHALRSEAAEQLRQSIDRIDAGLTGPALLAAA